MYDCSGDVNKYSLFLLIIYVYYLTSFKFSYLIVNYIFCIVCSSVTKTIRAH